MSFLSFKPADFLTEKDAHLERSLAAAASHLPQDIHAERVSLRSFVEQAWRVIEPSTEYVDNWHIGAICEHLEAVYSGQISQLIISMPPRHMKSITVAVMFPAWVWTFDPGFKWLFASYAQALSIRDSVKCRDVIKSPWYQGKWGHVYQIKKDQDQKGKFENTRKGYRMATGVDGSATGEGGDCVVGDDLLKAQDAYSELKKKAANSFWCQTMHTRQNNPQKPKRILIAQRLHENDTTGYILREKGGYVHLCLPSEYSPKVISSLPVPAPNPIGFEDPRKVEGELLWPNRFDEEAQESTKLALGEYGYAAQCQQVPTPESGGIIKKAWIRRYTLDEIPKSFEEIFLSWDMTFKDTKQGSYVCGQVWGKQGANFYILDQVRARWDFVDTVKEFERQCDRWPMAFAKYVEDKANGPAVISMLKNKIMGLIAVTPKGSKTARMHAMAPAFQAGNVLFPENHLASWVEECVHEIVIFPNGANDDQADCASQGLSQYIDDPLVQLDF